MRVCHQIRNILLVHKGKAPLAPPATHEAHRSSVNPSAILQDSSPTWMVYQRRIPFLSLLTWDAPFLFMATASVEPSIGRSHPATSHAVHRTQSGGRGPPPTQGEKRAGKAADGKLG